MVPRLPDGNVAVYVYGTHSRHHFIEQLIPKELRDGPAEFSLSPRAHLLEIECRRPNAWVILHGGINFETPVEPDTTYVLDCAPTSDYENHFSLTRVEPEETKEPPPQPDPWIGCYDVTVSEGDASSPLGRVRLTDRLVPNTAGMYEAHVVKSLSHLVSVSWWPVSPTSLHLGLNDGDEEWSEDLEQTPTGLQGPITWAVDAEHQKRGWRILASKETCEP